VLIVLIVAAVMVVFGNLKSSRLGRAWIAIREDEDAARAMGIRTGPIKVLAFLIGAMLAGVAGAVFAHKTGTVSYESFQFLESVTLLAAVILGGMGTIPGAVLGASVLFVLPEKLREFSDYRLLLFGIALVRSCASGRRAWCPTRTGAPSWPPRTTTPGPRPIPGAKGRL
jgi:branched-chain amino acid transport system permease protein